MSGAFFAAKRKARLLRVCFMITSIDPRLSAERGASEIEELLEVAGTAAL
jgi:hypothetical protein